MGGVGQMAFDLDKAMGTMGLGNEKKQL